jgi:hypothetical protein
MARPSPTSNCSFGRALLWLLLGLVPAAAWASANGKDGKDKGGTKPIRPGDPYLTLPLDSLGFDPIQPAQLVSGATFFTLNFVDNSHLLLTYNSHGLIPRVNDGIPQTDDRMVTALLLELSSGHILARTTWHTRDHMQYLFPLSHGLFLLRIRSQLKVIDPMRNLATGDAFQEQKFLDLDHPIGYISVSPGGDLLVVETIAPPHPESTEANGDALRMIQFNTEPTAEIRFFRLIFNFSDGDSAPHLVAQNAGQVGARNLIRVPATAEGFLDPVKESGQTWDFDFQSHAGKRLELAPFDTTCAPSPYFVSRSEFIALGCRGSDTRLMLSGFNLRGEQPWIQVLSGQQIAPYLVTAPDAGRFAFSRVLIAGTVYDLQNLTPEEVSGQEIQVLQHHDGRLLLRVMATPIQRSGQNFDLSPDGLSFTVIRNGNLEVYHLPALTPKDLEQVKLAAADQPQRTDARIRLLVNRPRADAPATAAKRPQSAEPALAIDAPSTVAPPPPPANAGDVHSDEQRTPPSLYSPEYPKNPKQ